MTNPEIIGLVVGALIALATLVSFFVDRVVKPVSDLNLSIQTLNSTMKYLNDDVVEMKVDLKDAHVRLNNVERALDRENIRVRKLSLDDKVTQ